MAKDDLSILSTGKNPAKDNYTITLASDLPQITALRLEALTDDSLTNKSLSRGNELSNLLVVSAALANLALVSLAEGDVERARSLAAESLMLCTELGDKPTTSNGLNVLSP